MTLVIKIPLNADAIEAFGCEQATPAGVSHGRWMTVFDVFIGCRVGCPDLLDSAQRDCHRSLATH